MSDKKEPDFTIFESFTRKGKKFTTKIGVAFKHDDDEGYNLLYEDGQRHFMYQTKRGE
jgi:hypothetical protein